MSPDELHNELIKLEQGIINERRKLPPGSGSAFSYWLYERRVETYAESWRYWSACEVLGEVCAWDYQKISQSRIEDIIRQAKIDRDDFPEDECLGGRAVAIIRRAKELSDYCNKI